MGPVRQSGSGSRAGRSTHRVAGCRNRLGDAGIGTEDLHGITYLDACGREGLGSQSGELGTHGRAAVGQRAIVDSDGDLSVCARFHHQIPIP